MYKHPGISIQSTLRRRRNFPLRKAPVSPLLVCFTSGEYEMRYSPRKTRVPTNNTTQTTRRGRGKTRKRNEMDRRNRNGGTGKAETEKRVKCGKRIKRVKRITQIVFSSQGRYVGKTIFIGGRDYRLELSKNA